MRKGPNPDPLTNEEGGAQHHPSFGMVEISRYTCTPPQNFFGSSVRHHSGVCLRIHRAHKQRSLAEDRYYADETIIEINMAAAQYADMICSPNIGDGVPCTIRMFNAPKALPQGKLIEACPEESVRQRIHQDFDAKMKAIGKQLTNLVAQAEALQEKPSINKADRKVFVDLATSIRCQVEHNLPFIHQQFTEAMDNSLTDAKASLESFVSQLARSLGSEQLAAQLTTSAQGLLPEPAKPNEPPDPQH